MKKKIGFMVILLTVIVPTVIYTQTMSDYCSAPPFVTRTVPPNVVIILDNSSAMLAPAYPLSDHYESSTSADYIGYFDPRGKYCAEAALFYETAGTCQAGDNGPYPGALLNWASMSKYDILMHLLVGGLGASEPDSDDLSGNSLNRGWTKTTTEYSNCDFTMSNDTLFITGAGCPLQNPASKIIVRNGRKERGLIPVLVDRNNDGAWDISAPRIAVMSFQSTQDDIAMAHCISGTSSLHALYDGLSVVSPDEMRSRVPLGKAVIRAIEYYKNVCPVCDSCADPIDSMQCRKNFVISAGTGDATDIPSDYSADYIDEQIRQTHSSDIRADHDGTQAIQYFTINIFGSATGRELMKGFSKYGGFIDANANKLPDLDGEWDRNGDGIPDTYFEAPNSAAIRSAIEKAFSDILARSASGTAVSMLSASSIGAGGIVQANFLPAKQDGTREVLWTGYMQNIWVDPDENLREDSVHDFKLNLSQDKIVKFFFNEEKNETEAAFFTTRADGSGGTLSSCSNPEVRQSTYVETIWEAGKSLALKKPSERTIFTAKKIFRGETVMYLFAEAPYPVFQTTMNSTLLSALNPDTTYTADGIVRYIRGECVETGVTGDDTCSNRNNPLFRDRRLTVDGVSRVWKLGDIMNSTPKAFTGMPLNSYHVDYADRTYYDYIADSSYRRKSSVVFAGANDGMLHAFRGGYLQNKDLSGSIKALLKNSFDSGDDEHDMLGEEIWAYIPFNAFPYLKYLAAPNYCHISYSDLSVKVVDVSLHGGVGATRDQSSWKTILLGGMRFGGACGVGGNPSDPPAGTPAGIGLSSYFALDVTDPERPVPLWEFSDDDMGYATSTPAILRTGDRLQNGKWYVVFGSGSKVLPKGGNDIGRNTPGYVYILNLGTGELVKKIKLDHRAIVGDMLAIDADRDYVTEKVYFGTSHQAGTGWMGKIMSLDVPAVLESSAINVSWNSSFGTNLFSGNYPFTASPDAAKDTKGNIWVYAGSGKYYCDVDEADTSQQIFFGFQDKRALISEAALYDATHVSTRGDVTGTARVCAYDALSNRFRLQDIVTSINPAFAAPADADPGWKIYLPSRERVISRPVAVGGLLDFLTYKPDADPCMYGGDSYLYSVRYTAGVAPARIAIRSPAITTGVSGTVTVYNSIPLGSGPPPAGNAIIIQPIAEGSEHVQKNIQLATGVIVEAENQPLYSVVSKIVHLLKK